MHYSIFTDTDWLYPDSPHNGNQDIQLTLPLGGHAGAQILGDIPERPSRLAFTWSQDAEKAGLTVSLFRLLPVGVNENTDSELMTTTDYERCKSFVTRKAPFDVYDALCPLEDGSLENGSSNNNPLENDSLNNGSSGQRLVLYLRIDASIDAVPGNYSGELCLYEDNRETKIPLTCKISPVLVPPVSSSALGMLNFFDYDGLANQHHVAKNSEEYWALFSHYVKAQIQMRCTHILLPPGEAIFENGKLIDFDFSMAERAGQIARQEGARFLCGGHIAHWHEWDEQEYYPNWDQTLGITTTDGYLQLRLYLTKWNEIVTKNHWQEYMSQALADEPQTHNDATYRILAGIFRKFMPGIPIIDAVETTNLGGGIDIWVPKQDTYEKWRDEYEKLQAAGETMWFYTCAFPAGPIMNRSMDLPLTASRAVFWMGALYRLSGFLHWGFNYYIGDDIWHSACCPHKGALLPAGDAHIVYPGKNGPLRSMRFEAQCAGAEDYELLVQAARIAPDKTERLIRSVCTSFRDYTRDGTILTEMKNNLISLLESEVTPNA